MRRIVFILFVFFISIQPHVFSLPAMDHKEGYIVPKMDPTLKTSAMALNVMEEHFKAYLSYTVNQMTPGYKEFTFANRYQNGQLEAVKFFRLGQGPPVETKNQFDCMIEGRGFFVIQGPWGPGYTRDGRFALDAFGRLVTFSDHFPIMGQSGPIILEKRDFIITRDGAIKIDDEIIDVLQIKEFADISNLDSFNSNLFYVIDNNPRFTENPEYRIRQGWYEGAAVVRGLLGELPRLKHVYEASTLVVRRVIKGYGAALSMAGQ